MLTYYRQATTLLLLLLFQSTATLTLLSPKKFTIHHTTKINLQVKAKSCPQLGNATHTFCWQIRSLETPPRSKQLNYCMHEHKITAPHFLALGGNIGNGTFSYTVQANPHSLANLWETNGFDPSVRPPSTCNDSGTFQIVTTCAAKFQGMAVSGMTNDVQTPPIDNAKCYEEWKDNKPSIYSMLNVLSAARSTFGTHYTAQAFGHGDKLFVEFIMQRHAFKHMVEFGTWTGITSLYFGMIAALRGGGLTTFDIADQRNPNVLDVWLTSMTFQFADLESKIINKDAAMAVQQSDFLFNDGWHKHIEAGLYAKYLPLGAGYLEHDYSYDHARGQEEYFLNEWGFEPMYEDVAVHLNSCARFWVRTEIPAALMAQDRWFQGEKVVEVDVDVGGRGRNSERIGAHKKAAGMGEGKEEDQEDIHFVQWAMQFETGRELLGAWRQQNK
jgi:hypothetical protein